MWLLVGFRFGVPLEEIRTALKAETPAVRQTALRRLSFYGVSEAEDAIVEALRDPAMEVRHEAARLAGTMGVRGAAPELTSWLTDPHSTTRAVAAESLRSLVRKDDPAVPTLIRMLSDADAPVRRAAAETLAALGAEKAALPLIGLLDDPDPFTREAAARSLGLVDAKGTADAIGQHLQDPEAGVRVALLRALAQLARTGNPSPAALSMVPSLRYAANDADDGVAVAALQALSAWAPEAATEILTTTLESTRTPLSLAAARLLGGLSEVKTPVKVWAALLKSTDRADLRDVCADALVDQARGIDAARAPRLVAFIEDALAAAPRRLEALTRVVLALPPEVAAASRDTLVQALIRAHGELEGRADADEFWSALAVLGGTESLVAILSAIDVQAQPTPPDAATSATSDPAQRAPDALTALETFMARHGPQKDAAGPLLSRLRQGDEGTMRLRLLTLLAQTRSEEAARGTTAYLRADPWEVRVRAAAVNLAGGVDDGLPILITAMANHDAAVRDVARSSLATYGRASHLTALVGSVADEGARDRRGLLDAAGAILRRDGEAVPSGESLAQALSRLALHEDPRVSFGALSALAQWGTDTAVKMALALRDRLPADREAARLGVISQAQRLFEDGRAALRHGLAHGAPAVAAVAAFGLAHHGDARDLKGLRATLDTAPYPARATVAYAYARLSERSPTDEHAAPLCAMVRSRIAGVRVNGIRGLRVISREASADQETQREAPCDALHALQSRAKQERADPAFGRLGAPSSYVASALLDNPALDARPHPKDAADWVAVHALDPVSHEPMAHAWLMLHLADGYMVALPADSDGALFARHLPPGSVQIFDALTMPLEP